MPSVYLKLSKGSQPKIQVCLDKHKPWTIPSANMTFTTLQNYITNMVVGKHGIRTFKVVIIVLLFDIFVPKIAHPLLCLDNCDVWIYLNEIVFMKKLFTFIIGHLC